MIAAKLTLRTTVKPDWEVITISDDDDDDNGILPIVMSANTSTFQHGRKMVEQQPTTSRNALAMENILLRDYEEEMDVVDEGQQKQPNGAADNDFDDDEFFENVDETAVMAQAGLPTINTTSNMANNGKPFGGWLHQSRFFP